MKAVVDRVVQYPHRYQLKNVNTGEILGTFDLEPITGTISVVGTKIDKALFDSIASDIADRLVSNGGDAKNNIVTYSMASSRSNVASGEKLSVSFGKIAKYFSDLKAVAFSGNKKDIDLGNVDNTSDANKPVSNATQQALNLKANASDVYSKTETDGLLNDKANKSDVYTKTEADGLLNDKANANDVYSKTKTDELLNNKANKSDVYTKTETDNEINKPLYNLGYYDTMVENSDGRYTITRQTGYLTINAEDITGGTYNVANSSNAYCTTIVKNYNKCIYNWDKIIGISSNGFEVRCLDFSWNKSNTIGINNDNNIYLAFSTMKTKTEIQALCPISIQYKLATATTEKVEKNHYSAYNQDFILEHNKSEAERSANLINGSWLKGYWAGNSINNPAINTDCNTSPSVKVTPNTIYSYNSSKNVYEIAVMPYDKNGNILSDDIYFLRKNNVDISKSFTTTSSTEFIKIQTYVSGGSDLPTDAMLNEGSVALPYQPYNQNKHITNNEADFLKTEHDRSANLFNANNVEYGSINEDGTNLGNGTNHARSFYFHVLPNTYYSISTNNSELLVYELYQYDSNKSHIEPYTPISNNTFTFLTRNNTYYIRILFRKTTNTDFNLDILSSVMLNEGTTALPYQPYEGKVVHEKELESYRKNIYTTSLDANTIYYSSNYYGYGITNTPSSYGNLLTFQYTNKNDIPNFAIQLFLDQSSNEGNPNMYMRGSTSDAYTSWKRLAFTSDLPTPGIFTKLGNKTNFSFDSGSYLVVANNGMVTVTGTDPLNVGSSANKKFVGIFMVTIAGYGGGQSVCVNTEEVFLGESASATISGPTFTIYKLN